MNSELTEKRKGVNYDYILAIAYVGERLEKKVFPILRHQELIDKLVEMSEDDNYGWGDMVSMFENEIICYGELPYCLTKNYSSCFVDKSKYPRLCSDKIKRLYKTFYEEEVRRRCAYGRRDAKSVDKIKESVRRRIHIEDKKNKKNCLKILISYIYAHDYHVVYKKNNITDYVFCSNETIGWAKEPFKINDEFSVQVSTNFFYGYSSYFLLTISYKGMPLSPYSKWVKYYHAGYNELHHYTHSYFCERKNWERCFDFVVHFVNESISNPNFLSEEISSQINDLLNGLEDIFHLTESNFVRWLDVVHDEDEKCYIGIRDATSSDREYYEIMPSECTMVFKMEKLSGALSFLENIEKLEDLYPRTDYVRKRIIDMNLKIYPEICAHLIAVNDELKPLKKELEIISKQNKKDRSDLEFYVRKLDKLLIGYKPQEEIEKIKATFLKRYPRYGFCLEKAQQSGEKLNELRKKIERRQEFEHRLRQYKYNVENYCDVS